MREEACAATNLCAVQQCGLAQSNALFFIAYALETAALHHHARL
jgi:hypothetical protein